MVNKRSAKVKERLRERGENVVCLAPTHAAARLIPEGDTVHHFVGKYAMRGAVKGWILLDEDCCLCMCRQNVALSSAILFFVSRFGCLKPLIAALGDAR